MSHPRNFLILRDIKQFWLPYIDTHPDCVSRDYYQVLKRFPKASPQTFRGLFDENGSLQAAAAIHVDEKPVFLELLLTAPWRKKGSGSQLLLDIVRESEQVGANGAIELKSAPTAIGFYRKYGFQILKPPARAEWDTPMRLTAEAASWLLANAVETPCGIQVPQVGSDRTDRFD
jgi:GNAT superfamily N-acetyltransferase|nr:GNAT family N-acetyltransferase [Leptolyngbya sp. Prado105]